MSAEFPLELRREVNLASPHNESERLGFWT
jgi:hypothetical protein